MPIFNIQFQLQAKQPNGAVVSIAPALALLQRGPVLPVSVCLEVNMARPLLAKGQAIVSHAGLALVDTGAAISAIDEEVAKSLKLPVIDQGKMTSASHESHPCNIYPVQMTLGGKLVMQAPRAMGALLKPQGLVALIGRDILQHCTLIYNGGAGTITLAV